MLSAFVADLKRHLALGGAPVWRQAVTLLTTQGVWATAVYRYGNWAYKQPLPVRLPAKVAYKFLNKWIEVATGISVPASAEIGPGFYIGHFGGIIVHPRTVMGEGCSIGQGVTIGTQGLGRDAVPVLGDRVYVGAGAKVLGGVRVGDDVAIGANAVVTRDVPSGVSAVGVPARVVVRTPAKVVPIK